MSELNRTQEQIAFLKNKVEQYKEKDYPYYLIITELKNKLENKYKDSLIVFMPDKIDFLKNLLGNWAFLGKTTKKIKWLPSQCHYNSCRYYMEEQEKGNNDVFIYTWYALSEDDLLWREHTWIVEKWKILETTVKRLDYYGIKLTWDDLEKFVFSNW